VWQWTKRGNFTREHVRAVVADVAKSLSDVPRIDDARRVFEEVALSDDFPEFLTIPAYERL
jgi:malate synthase